MHWIKMVVSELFGLFVDDGSFALAILVWLGLAWLVLPRLVISAEWNGAILFVGLACILVESAWRKSRS